MRPQPECIWDVQNILGEGPIWHAAEQALYFVDIKQHSIYRCDAFGGKRAAWSGLTQPSFLVPFAGGGFLCGAKDGLHRFDPASGRFRHLREIEPDQPDNRLNDGAVDERGVLWFGSMDDGESLPTGSLYSIGADRQLVRHDSGYKITNGPSTSPDGKVFYHTDTRALQIYAFDLTEDGRLLNKRVFATYGPGQGHPDGNVVDAEGFIWVGVFRGGRVDVFAPDGRLVRSIALPCPNVTKVAFGGPDLRTAYVTTARKGMSAQELAEYPLAGGLFAFRVDTPGLPQTMLDDRLFD